MRCSRRHRRRRRGVGTVGRGRRDQHAGRPWRFTMPVLQLGEKLKTKLDGLADAGTEVTLTITGPGGTRKGKNTIARYGAEGPWVIISTPQSGWFNCGGERGPGIAMSRALAAWAIKQTIPGALALHRDQWP